MKTYQSALASILLLLATACRADVTQPATTLPATTASTPTLAASVCSEIGQTLVSPIDGVVLVCVPAGEFLMGASETDALAKEHERPQHTVYLDAYWIDRTEITNASFLKCLEAGACQPEIYQVKAQTYVPYAVNPQYQNYPALLYEADVAAAYCEWAGRRLPTEAEWEKAARGPDGRQYVWGNAELSCELAGYNTCRYTSEVPRPAGVGTHAVDDYAAGVSPYGALNMAGNVWEWVADWYAPDYYAHSSFENPTGPATGEYRVRRGGGNESVEQDLRVTARASGEPEHYFDGQMGFRCALDAIP